MLPSILLICVTTISSFYSKLADFYSSVTFSCFKLVQVFPYEDTQEGEVSET